MTRLLCMALASACVSACAHAATLSATPANVMAQITAAQPGDTVQLGAGSYGHLKVWNVKKAAPGVTISPAPGAAPALIGISANGSAYLTFDGFDVAMTTDTWSGTGVTAQSGADHITFRRLKVHYFDNATPWGGGFQARGATNITLDSSEVAWAATGIVAMDSGHVTISNNVVHDWGTDAIDLAGVTDAAVTGNTGSNAHPPGGAHPDFIQWWSTTTTPTNNLDIESNSYSRGTGGAAQGIFGEDGTNITIKGNTLVGPMYNGIGLARTVGADIEGNFLQSYADMGTRIIVRGACDQVTINGNTSPAVINYTQAGETPCKTVTIGTNPLMSTLASAGIPSPALAAWLAAQAPLSTSTPPPTTNPLQSVVDSLNAAIAKLQAQVTTDQAAVAAQASATAALQAQLAQAQAALVAAQGQLAANAQAFASIKAAIPAN